MHPFLPIFREVSFACKLLMYYVSARIKVNWCQLKAHMRLLISP